MSAKMSSAEKNESGENNPINKRLDIDGENNQKTTDDEGLEREEKVKQFKAMLWSWEFDIAYVQEEDGDKGESEAESDCDDKDESDREKVGNKIRTEARHSPKKKVVSHWYHEGTIQIYDCLQETHNVQFGALWKEVKSDW